MKAKETILKSLLSTLLCIGVSLGALGCSTNKSTSTPSRRIQYSISGNVHDSGEKTVLEGTTLLQALAGARLHTFGTRYVQVIRDESSTTFLLRDLENDPTNDILLKDGDSIIVTTKEP